MGPLYSLTWIPQCIKINVNASKLMIHYRKKKLRPIVSILLKEKGIEKGIAWIIYEIKN